MLELITLEGKTIHLEEGRIFSRFVDNDNRMHTIHKYNIDELFTRDNMTKREVYEELFEYLIYFIRTYSLFRNKNFIFYFSLEPKDSSTTTLLTKDIEVRWDENVNHRRVIFEDLKYWILELGDVMDEDGPPPVYTNNNVKLVILGDEQEHDVCYREIGPVINREKIYKEKECIKCATNEPDVLFCNCGHMCICKECKKMMLTLSCPTCKKEDQIIRIVE